MESIAEVYEAEYEIYTPEPTKYAPELCEHIRIAFPKWKCMAGNLIDFDKLDKKYKKKMKRYVWIQIPKCYERYSHIPEFLYGPIQCEILMYQPENKRIKKKTGKN